MSVFVCLSVSVSVSVYVSLFVSVVVLRGLGKCHLFYVLNFLYLRNQSQGGVLHKVVHRLQV